MSRHFFSGKYNYNSDLTPSGVLYPREFRIRRYDTCRPIHDRPIHVSTCIYTKGENVTEDRGKRRPRPAHAAPVGCQNGRRMAALVVSEWPPCWRQNGCLGGVRIAASVASGWPLWWRQNGSSVASESPPWWRQKSRLVASAWPPWWRQNGRLGGDRIARPRWRQNGRLDGVRMAENGRLDGVRMAPSVAKVKHGQSREDKACSDSPQVSTLRAPTAWA